MAAIGPHTFLQITGGINPGTGEQVEEITRPGVDGVAYRRLGRRGVPFRLQSVVDVSSEAAAQAIINSYKTCQGTVVDIEDATGRTWNNYIVLRVIPASIRAVHGASGGVSGAPAYLVTASWVLQATGMT